MVKEIIESINQMFGVIGITFAIGLGILAFTGHIKIIDFAGKVAVIIN